MSSDIAMAYPDDMWSLIVAALIYYQTDEDICEACLIDTRMLIDLIQQVLDAQVEPHRDWVDDLNDRLQS
jgi:hypothetical protein